MSRSAQDQPNPHEGWGNWVNLLIFFNRYSVKYLEMHRKLTKCIMKSLGLHIPPYLEQQIFHLMHLLYF